MSKFIISGFSDEISPTIEEQIAGVKTLGLTHLVLRFVNKKNIADLTMEEARDVKRMLDASGLRVSSLGSPIGKVEIGSVFADEMKRLLHVLKLAKLFETKYIRIFSFYMTGEDDYRRSAGIVKERLGAMATVAAEFGVTLIHENEKGIFGDNTERCREILKDLEPYGLKGAFDPANFVQCGVDPLEAFRVLQPYVAYMHIKDALFSDGSVVPAGYGDGRIWDILYALSHDGVDAEIFLSLEPHLGNFAGLAALEKDSAVSEKPEGGFSAYQLALQSLQNVVKTL